VKQFREGLRVCNAIERLMLGHTSGLDALQQTAWTFVLQHYHVIQTEAGLTLDMLTNHPLAVELLKKFPVVH